MLWLTADVDAVRSSVSKMIVPSSRQPSPARCPPLPAARRRPLPVELSVVRSEPPPCRPCPFVHLPNLLGVLENVRSDRLQKTYGVGKQCDQPQNQFCKRGRSKKEI